MCKVCKPIEPKDETWWDDMEQDSREYLDSLVEEGKKTDWEEINEL